MSRTAPPELANAASSVQSARRPFGVQPRSRLVEEERLRAPGERERDGESAALAAREASGLPCGDVGEAEPVEQLVTWDGATEVRAYEIDDFVHAERRREPHVLEHDADVPTRRRIAGVGVEQSRRARVGTAQPQQQRQRSRLAGSVGAEQPEHLASPELEVDVRQRDHAAVGLACRLEAGDAGFAKHGRSTSRAIPRRLGCYERRFGLPSGRMGQSGRRPRAHTDADEAVVGRMRRHRSAEATSGEIHPTERGSRCQMDGGPSPLARNVGRGEQRRRRRERGAPAERSHERAKNERAPDRLFLK